MMSQYDVVFSDPFRVKSTVVCWTAAGLAGAASFGFSPVCPGLSPSGNRPIDSGERRISMASGSAMASTTTAENTEPYRQLYPATIRPSAGANRALPSRSDDEKKLMARVR